MRYRVTFRKRFNEEGEPADFPSARVDLPGGVVQDAELIEILPPASIHAAEDINAGSGSESSEDNGFLAFGTETWEYDVADGREDDFKNAVLNTELALAIEEVPDEWLTA